MNNSNRNGKKRIVESESDEEPNPVPSNKKVDKIYLNKPIPSDIGAQAMKVLIQDYGLYKTTIEASLEQIELIAMESVKADGTDLEEEQDDSVSLH